VELEALADIEACQGRAAALDYLREQVEADHALWIRSRLQAGTSALILLAEQAPRG